MHLVCLGVMKKMLLTWTSGKHKLSLSDITKISDRMIQFQKYIPSDFARKPRSLKDIKHFKATEFRMFILYIGPAVLSGILEKEKYKHFLMFHSAIYILVSKLSNEKDWVEYAGYLLNQFVVDVEKLYYREILTYNMHTLKHLHKDAEIFGSLDHFSAFEFENYMQHIKRLLRSKNADLSQMVKRISELATFKKCETSAGLTLKYSTKERDNCYLTASNEVCCIQKLADDKKTATVVFFDKIKNCKSYPFRSSLIDAFLCCELKRVNVISCDELCKKMIKLPVKNRFMCIPLCN
jgi:hypothetical protein